MTTLLFMNEKIKFAVFNCIYLILGISAILYLRKNKKNYIYVTYFIPVVSIPLVVTALIYYPGEQIRIAWFLIIIIASFFLGGKRLGLIVACVSIIVIVFLHVTNYILLTKYLLMLSIIILILGSIVVYLYESRQESAKNRLTEINKNLEERVSNEIKKRLDAYKKANIELSKSAEELKQQKNAYRELAYYDTLTGLPNRVLFYDRLKHAIAKSKRDNSQLGILFRVKVRFRVAISPDFPRKTQSFYAA